MNLRTLVARSLWFHRRSHLGVVLGAAVATTVLVGALVVGDSVRWSLRRMALARIGQTQAAMATADRFFRDDLADRMARLAHAPAAPLLLVRGIAARQDGAARVNQAQVVGVDARFWKMAPAAPLLADDAADACVVNVRTARALGVRAGDTILVRVAAPSALPLDAPLSGEGDTLALRVTVKAVATDEQFGRFSLAANQVPPYNVFLPLKWFQGQLGPIVAGRANVLLLGAAAAAGGAEKAAEVHESRAQEPGALREPAAPPLPAAMRLSAWEPEDAQLEIRAIPGRGVELRTGRIFLDRAVTAFIAGSRAPDAVGVLTYFASELRVGDRATPYSMVSAVGVLAGREPSEGEGPPPRSPLVDAAAPAGMADDEVTINAWLAEDLQAKPGDALTMTYLVPGAGGRLEARESRFRIRAVIPMDSPAADRTLMPDFPGIAGVDNCRDWKPGIDIDLKRIRPSDQAYWDQYRGTPKAFVTLAAGRRMWANRFGDLTAVRFIADSGEGYARAWRRTLQLGLDPAALGLYFQPVRERALAASGQSIDFGQLFLGLSFFLVAAGVVLTALLFAFGAQQRAEETGLLLAIGFAPKRVRRLMLTEAAALTLLGAVAGTAGGIIYTQAVLYGLATVWKSAVGASDLVYHAGAGTLLAGGAAGVVVALAALWLTLRRQARAPARELLASGADAELRVALPPRARMWLGAAVAAAGALGAAALVLTMGSAKGEAAAGVFFGAGAMLLAAALGACHAVLSRADRSPSRGRLTRMGVAWRNATRRRGRSLATVSLVAFGAFLVVAVGANRKPPPEDPGVASSATGGFRLFGETTLPLHKDPASAEGRKAYALPPDLAAEINRIVPLRVHEGDDASCLNLNRVQKPRLVGVRPEALAERESFTFAETVAPPAGGNPWMLLRDRSRPDVVPCIGDAASIQWSIGSAVGREIPYTDGRGREFRLRIVGAVTGSMFQGMLVIDEETFLERFPTESGYRMLLIDTPAGAAADVSRVLSERLADVGLAVVPAAERLAEFNAMQNTYLGIFQTLGGLGLVLGSIGLGVVVLRNVLERRGELALMRAVGFRGRGLAWMVLVEHWGLLAMGLAGGIGAALLAVAPAVRSAGAGVAWLALGATLAAVAGSGMLWTYLAARLALRGPLLEALRNE